METYWYCFHVIKNNFHKFIDWEWDYYSGLYENSEPHGISNFFWVKAMNNFKKENK